MVWDRARGGVRRWAAVLGATLLVAAVAPLPLSAAQGLAATSSHRLTHEVASTTGHVNATAAARMPLRLVPASRHLPVRSRPTRLAGTATASAQHAVRAATPHLLGVPDLSITHVTMTQAEHDVAVQPPDPWVVANGAFIISTSNSQVRVMNRDGVVVGTIPTYALFDTDQFHFDSDPRILWDAAHGRWLGVVVTYDDPTYVDTSLTLAISDTANPMGTWTTHRFGFGAVLPDFPGIASSSDKVVLTANLYGDLATNALGTPKGTTVLAASWTSLLAGASGAGFTYTYPGENFNLRPARNAGAAEADVPLVYENVDTGEITYTRLTGAASSAVLTGEKDLGIADGQDLATAPREPGGTIGDATQNSVDSRIPDVVYRGDSLYFARTSQLNGDLVVEEYVVSMSSLATAPVVQANRWGTVGEDIWMPGVGISSGGAFFLSYIRSSPTVAPEAWAAGSLDGVAFTDSKMIAGSTGAYTGNRWGDFMGMTPDPTGSMAVWAATEVSNSDGYWQELVGRLVMDDTPPPAPAAPRENLVAGSVLGPTTVPVTVSWPAVSDPQSGVQRYALEDEFDLVVTRGTSVTRSQPWVGPGSSRDVSDDWHVAAYDDGGNRTWSEWSATLSPVVYQQTLSNTKYSAGWSSIKGGSYSGGSAKSSTRAGASATFRGSGQSFAWVSGRASTMGVAKVYVDGAYKATVSLKSARASSRNLVYAINFHTSDSHTVKIVVVSGRVDVDAFVVLQ